MVCILTVPATMTSHDLMKLMAPFNDVMEHMKIIRDSTPNQYMVLIKFSSQVTSPSFWPPHVKFEGCCWVLFHEPVFVWSKS